MRGLPAECGVHDDVCTVVLQELHENFLCGLRVGSRQGSKRKVKCVGESLVVEGIELALVDGAASGALHEGHLLCLHGFGDLFHLFGAGSFEKFEPASHFSSSRNLVGVLVGVGYLSSVHI